MVCFTLVLVLERADDELSGAVEPWRSTVLSISISSWHSQVGHTFSHALSEVWPGPNKTEISFKLSQKLVCHTLLALRCLLPNFPRFLELPFALWHEQRVAHDARARAENISFDLSVAGLDPHMCMLDDTNQRLRSQMQLPLLWFARCTYTKTLRRHCRHQTGPHAVATKLASYFAHPLLQLITSRAGISHIQIIVLPASSQAQLLIFAARFGCLYAMTSKHTCVAAIWIMASLNAKHQHISVCSLMGDATLPKFDRSANRKRLGNWQHPSFGDRFWRSWVGQSASARPVGVT